MLQNVVQGKRDSSIKRYAGQVSELVRVQMMISGCLEEPENQVLEHFHDHGGQSDWSIIVEACYAGLLENGHYGGGLEVSWDVALLQRIEQRTLEPTGLHAVAGDTLSWPDAFMVFWLRKRLPSLSSGSVGSLLIVADFALYCVIVCRPCHTARVLLEEN